MLLPLAPVDCPNKVEPVFAVLPPVVLFVIAPKRGFAPAVLGVDPNAGADVDALLPKSEPDEGVFDG